MAANLPANGRLPSEAEYTNYMSRWLGSLATRDLELRGPPLVDLCLRFNTRDITSNIPVLL